MWRGHSHVGLTHMWRGHSNYASYSCVEGTFTHASYSCVEGKFTCASYSHVEGTFTCASYSHVWDEPPKWNSLLLDIDKNLISKNTVEINNLLGVSPRSGFFLLVLPKGRIFVLGPSNRTPKTQEWTGKSFRRDHLSNMASFDGSEMDVAAHFWAIPLSLIRSDVQCKRVLNRKFQCIKVHLHWIKVNVKSASLPDGLVENLVCRSHRIAATIKEKFRFLSV